MSIQYRSILLDPFVILIPSDLVSLDDIQQIHQENGVKRVMDRKDFDRLVQRLNELDPSCGVASVVHIHGIIRNEGGVGLKYKVWDVATKAWGPEIHDFDWFEQDKKFPGETAFDAIRDPA